MANADSSAGSEGKFEPSDGSVLVIIGQDKNAIEEYVAGVGIVPAGFMFYTSVQRAEGLSDPSDSGSGVVDAQYFVDRYPDTVLQIGLYMVDALEGVLRGDYDDQIRRLGAWMKKAGRPVYLRIGYEFDGPHNRYDPAAYQKAYRYIVDMLRRQGVDNVAYVWHSYAGHISRPLDDWYPGDDYVDWAGISYFSSRTKYMDAVAAFARTHHKPLMIAESTPRGIGTRHGGYALQRWFEPFFSFIAENNVKAVCYINADWDKLPMWEGQGWRDASIQRNQKVKDGWIQEVKREGYLHASPDLYRRLGYQK